jgi:hypothetical protein
MIVLRILFDFTEEGASPLLPGKSIRMGLASLSCMKVDKQNKNPI